MGRKNTKALVQDPPPADTSSSEDSGASFSSSSSSEDTTSTPVVSIPSSTKPAIYTHPTDDEDSDDHTDNSDDDEVEKSPSPSVKPTPAKLTSPIKIKSDSKSASSSLSQKRPAEKNASEIKPSDKKARKEIEKSGATSAAPTTGPTPQKVPFQRLWTEEDEITLLNGLIEFQTKRGVDPILHPDDYFNSIKGLISIPGIKKDQTIRKIRGIRQRFINALKKNKTPTQPHELEVYNLCKKVWDGQEMTQLVKKAKSKAADEEADEEEEEEELKSKKVLEFSKFEIEDELLDIERLFSEANGGTVVKKVMATMDETEKLYMKSRVKRANMTSLEAYLNRMEVLTATANKMLVDLKKN